MRIVDIMSTKILVLLVETSVGYLLSLSPRLHHVLKIFTVVDGFIVAQVRRISSGIPIFRFPILVFTAADEFIDDPGTVSSLHAMHCLHEAGFPKGLFCAATGKGSEIGDLLTTHPKINCIS